jgi:transposase
MKIDGRSLSHESSEEIRRLAVQRVKEGEKPSAVIKSYGLNRTSIYRWLDAEEEGGAEALASKRSTGRDPTLTPEQMVEVRSWICGKDPRQYGFDFGLWTRKIVASLIETKFGIKLGLTAVGRLLHKLKISPQKPLRRAYERDPVAIERWKQTAYPALRARAKRAGADIFFLDEAGVRSDQVLGRTWGARGVTPEVPTSGKRQSVNVISAVNKLGAFWAVIFTGFLNAPRFIEFLAAFLRTRRRPVFLVVDGHPAHTAKAVAQYVQSRKGRLELHFLPGYAPELNPDEFVWNHLKRQGVSKKPLKKGESLKARVADDLANIKKNRGLVRSFFRAPSVAYLRD